ncbi:MAG: class I SAM-dependent methyltransferase, partial [Chloroflexota bacterium]
HYLDSIYKNCECVAIDLSPSALQLVQMLNPEFLVCQGNGTNLPIKSDYFDVSFSIGLIEHFSRNTAENIVKEKIRITKPGGLVIVMVPWISSVYNHLFRKLAGIHWPFGDENPFHRQELKLFLHHLGLEKIKIFVIYGTTLLGMGFLPK